MQRIVLLTEWSVEEFEGAMHHTGAVQPLWCAGAQLLLLPQSYASRIRASVCRDVGVALETVMVQRLTFPAL